MFGHAEANIVGQNSLACLRRKTSKITCRETVDRSCASGRLEDEGCASGETTKVLGSRQHAALLAIQAELRFAVIVQD